MISEKDINSLHFGTLTIDAHCDTITVIREQGRDLNSRSKVGHIDIPRMMEGGVNLQFFAIAANPFVKYDYFADTITTWNILMTEINKNPNFVFVKNYEEIVLNFKKGNTMAFFSTENGDVIEGDIEKLYTLHRLGLRCFGLTWNGRNAIADGVGELPTDSGLTNFGKEVVKACNKLNILIDVSHIAPKGFWDTIELSIKPIVATHSNAAVLHNHRRNLTDDQIKAIADRGGVIGINFYSEFLSSKPATVDDVLKHIDHTVSIGGINSVGLGSDFDGMDKTPKGLEDVSKMVNITAGLKNMGYKDEDIKKILGGNFLRVIKEVIG